MVWYTFVKKITFWLFCIFSLSFITLNQVFYYFPISNIFFEFCTFLSLVLFVGVLYLLFKFPTVYLSFLPFVRVSYLLISSFLPLMVHLFEFHTFFELCTFETKNILKKIH